MEHPLGQKQSSCQPAGLRSSDAPSVTETGDLICYGSSCSLVPLHFPRERRELSCMPQCQDCSLVPWLHPAHSAEQCSADVPRNFTRSVVLCAAGLMPAAVIWGADPRLCSVQLCTRQIFLITPFPAELLLEIWLPKLLQCAPQPAVLTAHGSQSTYKIRSLSDVHSTTFDLNMSKAERERRVYPLEQESWK